MIAEGIRKSQTVTERGSTPRFATKEKRLLAKSIFELKLEELGARKSIRASSKLFTR